MLDSIVLPRLLLLSHAVAATGMAAWYFGWLPRGTSERRYLPLGLYMTLTVGRQLGGWLACTLGGVAAVMQTLPAVFAAGAVGLVGWVFWTDHRQGYVGRTWPWTIRSLILLHLGATYVWPVIGPRLTPFDPASVGPNLLGVGTLLWLIFNNLAHGRRHTHFLQWSLGLAVLGCLASGGLAIALVHNQALHKRDADLLGQVTAFAELLSDPRFFHATDAAVDTLEWDGLMRSICTSSDTVSGAFVLPADPADARFIARGVDPAKARAPLLLDPSIYARHVGSPPATVQVFRDLEDDQEWRLALAPLRVRGAREAPPEAVLGILATTSQVEASIAEVLLLSETIILFVALILYVCFGGYLHGVVRVWQRDMLLEINAKLSQRLLNTTSPTDEAADVVKQLQRRLGLLHASFWIYRNRADTPGFEVIAAAPGPLPVSPQGWQPMSTLPAAWQSALSRGQAVEGNLNDLGNPLPTIRLPVAGPPWAIAETIELHQAPWGAILLIFPDRRLTLRGEIRPALRALTHAFAFCLAREERSEHLAAAEERLRMIIETSPDGFWDADFVQDQCYCSDHWWRLLGGEPPAEAVARLPVERFMDPADLAQMQKDISEPLPPGRTFRRREYRARHADGTIRWIESNTVELRTVQGPAARAIGFDRDITQRHDYQARLREAAENSARANRAKSEFLATMNHELRTPLNSVIGFATILDRSNLDASQRDWVNAMRTSAEQLLGLISDVLDFSRIEAGRLELEVAPFELRRATEQALEHFSPLATTKQLALHYEFESPHQPNWVLGDTLRLRQILTNLVGNALKFTDRGYVRLRVRPLEHDHWQFVVEDTGPGIAPDRLDALFSRFSQLDASSTRNHGGTGLGLAISRELARAMQGDITVESTPGSGSIFTAQVFLPPSAGESRRYTDHQVNLDLVLPVFAPDAPDLRALRNALHATGCELRPGQSAAQLIDLCATIPPPVSILFPRAFRAEAIAVAQDLRRHFADVRPPVELIALQPAPITAGLNSVFNVEIPAPLRRRDLINALDRSAGPLDRRSPSGASGLPSHGAATAPLLPPQPTADFHVLVAEDHPVNREVVGTMLKQLGVRADFAENGAVAIEHLGTTHYHLALIDIQMPVIDGFGVADWVRAQWPHPFPPPFLVALTANTTNGDRERCLAAGMDDYLAKPLTFTTLANLIKSHHPNAMGVAANDLPDPSSVKSAMPSSATPAPASDLPPPRDDLVDWPNFEAILSFTNAEENPEVLRRIIVTYLTDRDQVLAEVATVPVTNHSETRRLLHKLKGSTGSLALMGAVETIKRLHDATRGPNEDQKALLLREIRADTDLAVDAVRRRYPWLNADQT